MTSKSVTILIRPRGKPVPRLPEDTDTPLSADASSLYKLLAAKTGHSEHRLRITKGSDGSVVPNLEDVTIESTGLRNQSIIFVKDLGPQIAWRTVFLAEYLGPILMHLLVYTVRPYLYSNARDPPSQLQKLSLLLVLLHFVKREYETLFVHRFSLATMPARNIFKNCFHYWVFSGANMAYWIYAPTASAAQPSNPFITGLGVFLFVWGEASNYMTHQTLRNLRSAGGKERGIPQGYGFDWVTCPNYLFETVAWTGILLITWSWSTVVFIIFAVAQMMSWAAKKEGKLRKEFGSRYKKKRYMMLPGIF